jgi:predicted nucleic acid-binding protein
VGQVDPGHGRPGRDERRVSPIVLDSGALVALEKRKAKAVALLAELVAQRRGAHVPAGVVAQVWRGTQRQHAIARLLRTRAVRVAPLSEDIALRVGVLLGATRTRDIVDGHVALIARALGATVVTSDPDDIGRLDPTVRLERI